MPQPLRRTLERLARELGLGGELALVPHMADPKKLWGWARGEPAPT